MEEIPRQEDAPRIERRYTVSDDHYCAVTENGRQFFLADRQQAEELAAMLFRKESFQD